MEHKTNILAALEAARQGWLGEFAQSVAPGGCDDRAYGAQVHLNHLEKAAAAVTAAVEIPREGDKEGWKAFLKNVGGDYFVGDVLPYICP